MVVDVTEYVLVMVKVLENVGVSDHEDVADVTFVRVWGREMVSVSASEMERLWLGDTVTVTSRLRERERVIVLDNVADTEAVTSEDRDVVWVILLSERVCERVLVVLWSTDLDGESVIVAVRAAVLE